MPLLLNCDLGECPEAQITGLDDQVMPFIDQANIACGFHAGDHSLMKKTLLAAKQHNIAVGAHPSYPDSVGFGRRSMNLPPADIIKLVQHQVRVLREIAETLDIQVSYVKPHGALYNDMMINGHLRSAIMQAIVDCSAAQHRPLAFMLQATADAGIHRQEAQMFGLEPIFEAFADRCYNDDGSLLSRNRPAAVHSREKMLEQVQQLTKQGTITTVNGLELPLQVDSICVHGDNRESVNTIKEIRQLINQ